MQQAWLHAFQTKAFLTLPFLYGIRCTEKYGHRLWLEPVPRDAHQPAEQKPPDEVGACVPEPGWVKGVRLECFNPEWLPWFGFPEKLFSFGFGTQQRNWPSAL